MKKTQITDSIRNIRKRIVSYLSICLVIMLGIGVFLAMRYMYAGIAHKASAYLQQQSFKDFEFLSSLGAGDSTVSKIRDITGVTDAEGVMQYDATLRTDDVKRAVTVLSVTERISVPLLTDGRMPASPDECVIGEDFSEESGISIGDTVSLRIPMPDGGDDPLKEHRFKVCGLIKHPDYIHRNVTDTVVLPLSSFSSDGDTVYTRVFIRTDDVSPDDFYSERYFDITAEVRSNLEIIEDRLATDRKYEVRDEALAEIDREWEKAESELADAQSDIDSGRAELRSKLAGGRRKLRNAEKKLSSELKKAGKELEDGQKAIEEGDEELQKGRTELDQKKKELSDAREEFESNLGPLAGELDTIDYLLTYNDDPEVRESEEYRAEEARIKTIVLENEDFFRKLIKEMPEDQRQSVLEELEEEYGMPLPPFPGDIDEEEEEIIVFIARELLIRSDHLPKPVLEMLRSYHERAMETKKQLDDAEAEIAEAERQLDDAEMTLNEKRTQLDEGRETMKREKAAAKKKIADGWKAYYSRKARYEAKLEEAKALLSENREEAERKIEEARAEAEQIECTGLMLDRNSNAGYLDVKSSLDSILSVGMVFGILFIMIAALVCFSTLVIIIEEQKTLIGTTKAFGFHKGEVLGKYLLFGASAALLGDILAVILGTGLCSVVLKVYSSSNIYQYGTPTTVFRPVPSVVISLLLLLVCSAAAVIACSDILRSPASMLMKGETVRSSRRSHNTGSSGGGSLYSRLIFRNMLDDKARVIVSTAIVAFCCMLIGVGFSFQLAFNGMVVRQKSDVNLYDFRIDYGSSITGEERRAFESVLKNNGSDYTEAVYESRLFDSPAGVSGLQLIAGDPSELDRFIGLGDSRIPGDGVLIPERMCEVFDLSEGDRLVLYDSDINEQPVSISGTYINYFGRSIICSADHYSRISDSAFEPNACYVKLGGADGASVRAALTAVSEDISFESGSSYKTAIESVRTLYNIIVYVTTGIAILMSFMILTNLSNIYIMRKKRELTVMRINGFSISQTKAYLARESLVTTLIGLTAGVIAGALLAPFAIRVVEPADLQFDRSLHILAWVAAVGLEGLFAIVIYSSTFRRIKSFSLRDIS